MTGHHSKSAYRRKSWHVRLAAAAVSALTAATLSMAAPPAASAAPLPRDGATAKMQTGHPYLFNVAMNECGVMALGTQGSCVATAQRLLKIFTGIDLVEDGYFGPKTESAVRQFQTANGLTPDGLIGTATKRALRTQYDRSGAIEQVSSPLPSSYGFSPRSQPRPSDGVPKVWSERREVEPPAQAGNYAAYQRAQFPVPVEPGRGMVRVGFFIAEESAMSYNRGAGGVRILGNDRSYTNQFHADRSKLTFDFDFERGEGRAYSSPTCVEVHVLTKSETICQDALALDASKGGSQLLYLTSDDNGPGATTSRSFVTLQYHMKISAFEKIPVTRLGVPAIDGTMTVALTADGAVCLLGMADTYPSIEAYHYKNGQITTLVQTPEGISPLGLINPPSKEIAQCSKIGSHG